MSDTNICPICKKEVDMSNLNNYRPFCSKRCQLIDLGQWVNESYSISDSNPNLDNINTTSKEKVKH